VKLKGKTMSDDKEVELVDRFASMLCMDAPTMFLGMTGKHNGSPFNMAVVTNALVMSAVRLAVQYSPDEHVMESVTQLTDTMSFELHRLIEPKDANEEKPPVSQ
jgi:hypothetical protein